MHGVRCTGTRRMAVKAGRGENLDQLLGWGREGEAGGMGSCQSKSARGGYAAHSAFECQA
eukprot:365014-Chlamydomonas_euryale.AAC.10